MLWDTALMTTRTPTDHHVSMRVRRPTVVVWTAALSAVAAGASLAMAGIGDDAPDRLVDGHVLAGATAALAFSLIGAAIARRLPSNRVGWLCLAIGAGQAVSGLVTEYGHRAVVDRADLPAGAAIASLDAWLWMPSFVAIITLLVAWFPDGQVYRRWVRVPLALAGLGVIAFVVSTAVMAWRLRGPAIFTADRIDDGSRLAGIADASLFLILAGAAGCVVSAFDRLRRARGREREQLLWFATGAALCVGLLIAAGPDTSLAPVVELIALPLIPAAIGIALLRYRLYDLEFVVNRVLLYAALTATIGVLYVSAVALFTNVLDVGSWIGAILASGIVAVGFDGVRRRLERVADRLLFGNRHDPAAAMVVEMTRSVSSASAPDTLDTIASALVDTLKLRAATVALRAADGVELIGSCGTVTAATVSLPLTFEGGEIGRLDVEAASGIPIDAAGRQLLDDLAAQIAIAAHALLLTTELRKSRARLIEAVEQERRRLRRDLHDGLGTALVGIVMQLEALSNLLNGQTAATDLTQTITTEARQLVSETRRLVHGLVPPVVEEVGLVEAVRQHADRLNRTGGRRGTFTIDADGWTRDRLPAAVEVAAYVVATEAMTNVARHARATRCQVRLRRDAQLSVEVTDDGVGFTLGRHEGVGLRSMRERTEDLDGSLVIEPLDNRGTRVLASLPLEVN